MVEMLRAQLSRDNEGRIFNESGNLIGQAYREGVAFDAGSIDRKEWEEYSSRPGALLSMRNSEVDMQAHYINGMNNMTVRHFLNRHPTVMGIDEEGLYIPIETINHRSKDELHVTFARPFTGKVLVR